jgi:hypothetical protein
MADERERAERFVGADGFRFVEEPLPREAPSPNAPKLTAQEMIMIMLDSQRGRPSRVKGKAAEEFRKRIEAEKISEGMFEDIPYEWPDLAGEDGGREPDENRKRPAGE